MLYLHKCSQMQIVINLLIASILLKILIEPQTISVHIQFIEILIQQKVPKNIAHYKLAIPFYNRSHKIVLITII